MTFYTLQYLQNQREVNQLVIYSLSALGLLILLFAVLCIHAIVLILNIVI